MVPRVCWRGPVGTLADFAPSVLMEDTPDGLSIGPGVCGWRLEIIRRVSQGFAVLPKRWVVERTFSWLGKHRRLSTEYGFLIESSEAYIHIAMTALMRKQLA